MFYITGISLSLFLLCLLVTKRGKSAADYILAGWLGVSALNLTTFYLLFSNQQHQYPTLIVFGLTLPILQGPFLYLYIILQTSSTRAIRSWLWAAFLPFIGVNTLFMKYYMLPDAQRVEVLINNGQGFERETFINLLAICASGVLFIFLSVVALANYRKRMVERFSNVEKINVNWLSYLIVWMIIIWGLVLTMQDETLIFASLTMFICWLGYYGIKQRQLFQKSDDSAVPVNPSNPSAYAEPQEEMGTSDTKYLKSALSPEKASKIHQKLDWVLREDKPFKNPDLTLNDLAKLVDVHPNQLSQVINANADKTFYELINELRIDEFTRQIALPENDQFTLLAIAYECGFNSKTSFNRNFKKYKGITPKEYINRLQQ